MTFLAPIPAIIVGSIALPVLIAFFLLKLRRRPVRVGSTMLWDQAIRDLQANVPLRWLRPTWLLLLSILILAMLLLALARPAIDLGASRADLIILIIDRSASMSATDAGDGRSRLDVAKARSEDLVASLRRSGSSAMVGVIASAGEARALLSPSRDMASVVRTIRAIEPTDQPGDLAAALALAQAQIESIRAGSEDADAPEALAVIFSDAGESFSQPLAIAGASARFEPVGPANSADSADAAVSENVGISAISATRDFDDPSIVRVFVRAQSTRPDLGVTIELLRDDTLVAREAIVFGEAAAPGVHERPVVFEFVDREGGLLLARIDRPDALASDDSAAVVLDPIRAPVVVLVREGAARNPAQWILDAVLGELRPRELHMVTTPTELTIEDRSALARADLIVLDGARLPPGATADVPILALGVTPDGTGGVAGESSPDPSSPEFATPVLSWAREHPVMRDVTLDTVFVARALDPGMLEGVGFSRGEALALGRFGPLIVHRADPATILVAFDLADSNWTLHFGFPIFIANAVGFLAPEASEGSARAHTTRDLVRLTPASGSTRVALEDERGSVVLARDVGDPGEEVSMGVIERAGVYRALGATVDRVAVNLADAGESSLASRDTLRIGGRSLGAGSGGASGPTEVWHWFVMAAGALATIEWVLYALRMRV